MNDAPGRTDEELARAAKRGDAAAFDALARRYLRPAMALAWQYAGGLEDTEDIVQEAFHRAVRALAGYDDERAFSAWFYAIVRNVARTAVSRNGRRAVLAPLTSADDLPATVADDPALAGDLERALDNLAPMQQACVQLCHVEGFTSIEAADMLGINEGTVRTHLHRARGRLRAEIGPQAGRHGGEGGEGR
jgi:RNA polymerase sigma-70 factor (ECF subfamily)